MEMVILRRVLIKKEGVEIAESDCGFLIESVDVALQKVLVELGLDDAVRISSG